MTTRRRQQFVRRQFAGVSAVLVALAALGELTYATFFVLSYVVFLVVVQATAPTAAAPAWRRRLRWFMVVGLAGFVVIAVRRAAPFVAGTA